MWRWLLQGRLYVQLLGWMKWVDSVSPWMQSLRGSDTLLHLLWLFSSFWMYVDIWLTLLTSIPGLEIFGYIDFVFLSICYTLISFH